MRAVKGEPHRLLLFDTRITPDVSSFSKGNLFQKVKVLKKSAGKIPALLNSRIEKCRYLIIYIPIHFSVWCTAVRSQNRLPDILPLHKVTALY